MKVVTLSTTPIYYKVVNFVKQIPCLNNKKPKQQAFSRRLGSILVKTA